MMAINIRKPLKKLLPFLIQGQQDSLNEADTVQRIVKVFEEVLGYDGMTEITRERQIKDKYVDLAVRVDGTVFLLVEVKAGGVVLRDRHIDQAQRYAAEGNIRWALLTNGVSWNLYHLTFEEGIEYERAFTLDLSADSLDRAAELLGLLHRQGVRAQALETYWGQRVALGPASIGRALFSEDVLRLIRRNIRKEEGILIDPEDLAGAIHGMLSTEARERIGPMRVRRKRKPRATPSKPRRPRRSGSSAPAEDSEPASAPLAEAPELGA
jgi:predicted type IV restriction endonuclease